MDLDPAASFRAFATRDVRLDGQLFGGVVTTGIYCRPVCPARKPRPENVRFFSLLTKPSPSKQTFLNI